MILKTKEASKYLGVSINTIKTLSNRLKLKSFKTAGGHRRFRKVIELRYKDVLEAKGEKNDKIAEQKDNRR